MSKAFLKLTLVALLLAGLCHCQDEIDSSRELCLSQCAVKYWDCYWTTGNNRKCQSQQHTCVLRCPKSENVKDSRDSSFESLFAFLNYTENVFGSGVVEKFLRKERKCQACQSAVLVMKVSIENNPNIEDLESNIYDACKVTGPFKV